MNNETRLRKLVEQKVRLAKTKQVLNLSDLCFPKQQAFIEDLSQFKAALTPRRCLSGSTKVLTTTGIKPIKDIQLGEYVYSEAGKPIKVLNIFNNGIREVYPLVRHNKEYGAATLDHVWLMCYPKYNTNTPPWYGREYTLSAIKNKNGKKIMRKFVSAPLGDVSEPHAYALAAMLGDGCCTASRNQLYLSSDDGYIIDIAVLKSWNRGSLLEFVAGIIDTDGSVRLNVDNTLSIQVGMQSESVIDALRYAFETLWQCLTYKRIDNRTKYKNGPVHIMGIKSNLFCKRILKELSPHLALSRKRYKASYDLLNEHNDCEAYAGFALGTPRLENTYDLEVDSPTHLYLTSTGLITHNSGKTFACCYMLLQECLSRPNTIVAYINRTEKGSVNTLNPVMKKIKRLTGFNATWLKSDKKWEFANGSELFIFGADANEDQQDKLRGQSYKLIVLDEAAYFRNNLQDFFHNVLVHLVAGEDGGQVVMISTPSNLTSGLYYEITDKNKSGWSTHKWDWSDNAYKDLLLKKMHDKLLLDSPGYEFTPAYKREWLGRWELDKGSLIYHFDNNIPSNNRIHLLPNTYDKYTWFMSMDIGYTDATAITVAGFSPYDHKLYYVFAQKRTKLIATDLMEWARQVAQDKRYPISVFLADCGSGGAKNIVEDLKKRYAIPFRAPKKLDKEAHTFLMDSDLQSGKIKLLPEAGEDIVDEWNNLIVDDAFYKKNGKWKELAACKNDICDSALYLWREAYNYSATEEPKKLHPSTEAYLNKIEQDEADLIEYRKKNPLGLIEQWDSELLLNPDL